MLGVLHLLLGLWFTIVAAAPTPVVLPVPTSAPVSAFFRANAGALVQMDTYRGDHHQIASCSRSGLPDRMIAACAGRDGLVVWRHGVRLQLAHRGFRT